MLSVANLVLAGLQKVSSVKDEYRFCCPFHSEKSPSAYLNPYKQKFYCFGCGAGMSMRKFFYKIQFDAPEAFVYAPLSYKELSFEPVSYEEFFDLETEVYKKVSNMFDKGQPVSREDVSRNYLTKRLGSNFKMPIQVRYNKGHDTLVWKWGTNFVTKRAQEPGLYLTHGKPAHLFTAAVPGKKIKTFILAEGVFDSLTAYQLSNWGIPGEFEGGAILTSHIDDVKFNDLQALDFEELVFFSDNDKTGQNALTHNVEKLFELRKKCYLAPFITGVKDIGEMTPTQVLLCLENKESILDIYLKKLSGKKWNL